MVKGLSPSSERGRSVAARFVSVFRVSSFSPGFESCSNGVIPSKAHQAYCHSKHPPSGLSVPELNSMNASRSQPPGSFSR